MVFQIHDQNYNQNLEKLLAGLDEKINQDDKYDLISDLFKKENFFEERFDIPENLDKINNVELKLNSLQNNQGQQIQNLEPEQINISNKFLIPDQ